jgi:YD repeat-containing protein
MSQLVLFFLFFATGLVHAETVEPRYIWSNNEGIWATKEEAKNYLIEQELKTQYASWWIIGDLIPDTSQQTLNGQHVGYTLSLSPSPENPNTYPPGTTSTYSGMFVTGECPAGFTEVDAKINNDWNLLTMYCTRPDPCDCKQTAGNPIEMSGAKIQREDDYAGPGLLRFSRIYRSDSGGWSNNFSTVGIDTMSATSNDQLQQRLGLLSCVWGIGTKIKEPYCYRRTNRSIGMTGTTSGNEFILKRAGQRAITFGTATNLDPAADINDRAAKIYDAGGNVIGWQVYNARSDTTEIFDLNGKLSRHQARGGQQLTMQYSDEQTSTQIAPYPGLLIAVSDSFGRHLNFTYDGQGRMSTLVDPGGGTIRYAYDEESSVVQAGAGPSGNLTSVTYQDGKRRIYWYNEPENTAGANLPQALTGITDEEGVRYATFKYDATGKAVSTEHAGGVQKYAFSYPSAVMTTVTDPLNTVRDYYSTTILNTSRDGNSDVTVNGSKYSTTVQFDTNGNVSKSWDLAGVLTTHSYDLTRNLETSRTEGSYSRTISTEWHPVFRLPQRIAGPNRLTTFNYDVNGLLLSKTIQATTDATGASGSSATTVGTVRHWTYTYNALGQLTSETGPRTDIVDQTRYAYDENGDLTSVTDSLGHGTSYSNYDADGRPGSITAPNGRVTNLSYSPRGWLLARSVIADGVTETTSYTYDGIGQLKTVVFPDGSNVQYTYDGAHRLTDVSDIAGNKIHYTLDNMGNRVAESVSDSTGTLTRQIARTFDALSQVSTVTGGAQ